MCFNMKHGNYTLVVLIQKYTKKANTKGLDVIIIVVVIVVAVAVSVIHILD